MHCWKGKRLTLGHNSVYLGIDIIKEKERITMEIQLKKVHTYGHRVMGMVQIASLVLAVGDAIGTTLEFSKRDSAKPITDMVGGPFSFKAGSVD